MKARKNRFNGFIKKEAAKTPRARWCGTPGGSRVSMRTDETKLHQWIRETIQCRKCRTPVKIIAIFRSLAAEITSSSRTEPPG